ncbi:MAG: imidazole glycerol phosphate synthase subunit HisH [Pseudomonadales bacterium]|nr:imidazole glycerol phosphate synthase subunit HisH [Pseudomonadales bacterium]
MIAIIDLDLGNLHSIDRAVQAVGGSALITDEVSVIRDADRLILPGVGSFKAGMSSLINKNLIGTILEHVDRKTPILGICLGMQLLMSRSEENGTCDGLDLIPGNVIHFSKFSEFNPANKVPHIGWSSLLARPTQSWSNTIFADVGEGEDCYFVHSYCVVPDNPEHILASTHYSEFEFPAAIRKNNVVGCQFHPEKSGQVGLKIINNFINNI